MSRKYWVTRAYPQQRLRDLLAAVFAVGHELLVSQAQAVCVSPGYSLLSSWSSR